MHRGAFYQFLHMVALKIVLHNKCTEVCLASFFSGEFITAIVLNPPERKLAKRTSVRCANSLSQLLRVVYAILYKAITLPVNEL